MTFMISFLLLFATCFGALRSLVKHHCAFSAQAVSLCTVTANATKYDGQKITIKGVYRMVLHGSVLTGSACPKLYVNLRRATDWKGDADAKVTIRSLTKKDRFQSVEVVVRGIFRVAREGQCFGQNCLPYEFEETELLCARRPPENSSESRRSSGTRSLRSWVALRPN